MTLTHSAILLGIQAMGLALVACGQPTAASGGFTELQRAVVTDASFYQPPGQWHIVETTADGARTIVFRVLKKGQPVIVAVE